MLKSPLTSVCLGQFLLNYTEMMLPNMGDICKICRKDGWLFSTLYFTNSMLVRLTVEETTVELMAAAVGFMEELLLLLFDGIILVWCCKTLVAWMAILMSFKAAATDSSDWQGSPAPPPSDPNENDVNLDVTSMYYCFFVYIGAAADLSKETLLLLLSQKKIHSNPSSLIGWNVSCTLLLMISFDLFGLLS
mgnify:CR=1 FL=1